MSFFRTRLFLRATLILAVFNSFITFNVIGADETLESKLTPHLENIYQQLSKQSQTAVAACKSLQHSLNDGKREDIIANYQSMVLTWKRVQSMYVISEYDEEAIDLPHYLDVFHRGNENLEVQIQRALTSDQPAKKALFKYSFKSINALERVLFAPDKTAAFSSRQLEFAKVITANICKQLARVQQKYQSLKTDFLSKPKKAVAMLLNELIDSSFKLKEWRLGDTAGLSRKRRGKSKPEYAEYRFSQLSVPAMSAILDTHIKFTQSDGEFAKIIALLAKHDKTEDPIQALADARHHAERAIKQLASLSQNDLSDTEKIRPIYDNLNDLHDSYFVELIESLSDIVARILDSDGD